MIKIPTDMAVGAIHKSKHNGLFEIIDYKKWNDVAIKFIDTGYATTVSTKSIRDGLIKDRLKRSVYGIGYFGVGEYKGLNNCKRYNAWRHMLCRCYAETSSIAYPTYADCIVCDEWHNYQVFSKWFEENYIEGCELDKDLLVDGNKVYGPDTCTFVSHFDNSQKAKAKAHRLVSPEGNSVEVYNVNRFSRDNNLNRSGLGKLVRGEINHHKGWTLAN